MIELHWPSIPNSVRCYGMLSWMVNSAKTMNGAVYRVSGPLNFKLGETSTLRGNYIRSKVGTVMSNRESKDFFGLVTVGETSTFTAYFFTRQPISDEQYYAMKRICEANHYEVPTRVDHLTADEIKSMFAELEDSSSFVGTSRIMMNRAVSFVRCVIADEEKAKREGARNNEAVERVSGESDQLDQMFQELEADKSSKAPQPVVELEEPMILLRKSASLFGKAVSIYTRQIAVKLREHMTSQSRSRRIT